MCFIFEKLEKTLALLDLNKKWRFHWRF